MAVMNTELIGFIIAGVIAGLVFIVVIVIVAVFCYRGIDKAEKKVKKKSRDLYYAENPGYYSESMYYGDSASTVGTTARLVNPYHIPVPLMYGHPSPYMGRVDYKENYESKKKTKAYVNHLQTMDRSSRYSEMEENMEFTAEDGPSTESTVNKLITNSEPADEETARKEEETVIVTYLERERTGINEVRISSKTEPVEIPSPPPPTPPPPPPPPLPVNGSADPDNGERTPSVGSGEQGPDHHHRQRVPPRGDITPPQEKSERRKAQTDVDVLY